MREGDLSRAKQGSPEPRALLPHQAISGNGYGWFPSERKNLAPAFTALTFLLEAGDEALEALIAADPYPGILAEIGAGLYFSVFGGEGGFDV